MAEQLITYILLGLSLAVDAFAVSVAEGLCCKEDRMKTALKQSAYFGFFQFLMPLIGFYLAGTVSDKITALGPYISFFMLALVGAKMLFDSLSKKEKEENCGFSHGKTILLAIATSIDALAVGISLAFTTSSVLLPSVIIGIITFALCVLGGLLCGRLPKSSGKGAGIVGGIVLIGIGIKILLEGIL